MIIMIIMTVICCQVLRPRSFPSWTPSGMSRFTAGAPLLGTGLTNHRRATIDASQAKMLGTFSTVTTTAACGPTCAMRKAAAPA
jgi:hypothetical protein